MSAERSASSEPSDIVLLCQRRRSVRRYTGEPIDPQTMQTIMEAGRWAATANNRQARRFVLIPAGEELRAFVSKAKMQPFVADAGVLVVGWATIANSQGAAADVIISLTQMEMAAVAAGLGTCWLGIFDQDIAAELIGGPAGGRVVCMLAIGHPADTGSPKPKLPREELFKTGTF